MNNFRSKSFELLGVIYKDEALKRAERIFSSLYERWQAQRIRRETVLSEKDVILIAYGDSIISEEDKPLKTLKRFLDKHCREEITNVHLLPIYPSTSDDGFSVANYRQIDEKLGDWDNIEELSKDYGLMLDAVVNHSSKSHHWFKACLEGVEAYRDYYIAADPNADYSQVTRPRTSPLLTKFQTVEGEKYYWTTFSEDQVDLNYANPQVLAEVMDVLLFYAAKGAKFIRLDAIGFIYKKLGTSCMHLKETHAIVKLMRLVLEEFFPGTYLITETNVPHAENISYFGDGDEAHLVYQFPLPPLVLFSLQKGDATKLTRWAQSLEATPLNKDNTYFNFLASHDGVGVRPAEGILSQEEMAFLLQTVTENGGKISYKVNPDGSKSPYELNISYMDGITNPSRDKEERYKRFMASQAIMLSLQGVPGIYYHSLLGSGNWYDDVTQLTEEKQGIRDEAPSWSPDRKKIVFTRNNKLWLLDLDSKEEQELAIPFPELSCYYPRWSPDGKKIAFIGGNLIDQDIYVMDLQTGETTPITDDGHLKRSLLWTPDGKKLVYGYFEDSSDFYWIEPDGKNKEKLTDGECDYYQLEWLPMSVEN
ncbi:MAG TPA: sugar phosphorylase [Hydrogenispora sp.]|nr:sugar phosphorylase [Hydrogenispora sp.]